MGFHTYDLERADRLERPERRYRYLSAEELLWAIDPTPDTRVVDIGSGTGFYTDVVAPAVDSVYAVDIQAGMHAYYREKGVPDNVDLVTSPIRQLPLEPGSIDTAFSTMTYHEFADAPAIEELHRILEPDGRVVIVDWAASGSGDAGPPVDERYAAGETRQHLESGGFEIQQVAVRPETFLVIASAD